MSDPQAVSASFFRYIRPIDKRTGFPDSSKGTCLHVVMDYTERVMYVSAAVCDGDNFSKAIAKQLTSQRMEQGEHFIFDLDDFVESGLDLVEYVVNTLHSSIVPKNTPLTLAVSITKQAKLSAISMR